MNARRRLSRLARPAVLVAAAALAAGLTGCEAMESVTGALNDLTATLDGTSQQLQETNADLQRSASDLEQSAEDLQQSVDEVAATPETAMDGGR